MLIIAQGLVGLADAFIHPQYTASGMWLKEWEGLVFFIMMGFLFLSYWYLAKYLFRIDKENKEREMAKHKWLEPNPPSGRER